MRETKPAAPTPPRRLPEPSQHLLTPPIRQTGRQPTPITPSDDPDSSEPALPVTARPLEPARPPTARPARRTGPCPPVLSTNLPYPRQTRPNDDPLNIEAIQPTIPATTSRSRPHPTSHPNRRYAPRYTPSTCAPPAPRLPLPRRTARQACSRPSTRTTSRGPAVTTLRCSRRTDRPYPAKRHARASRQADKPSPLLQPGPHDEPTLTTAAPLAAPDNPSRAGSEATQLRPTTQPQTRRSCRHCTSVRPRRLPIPRHATCLPLPRLRPPTHLAGPIDTPSRACPIDKPHLAKLTPADKPTRAHRSPAKPRDSPSPPSPAQTTCLSLPNHPTCLSHTIPPRPTRPARPARHSRRALADLRSPADISRRPNSH